MGGRGKGRGSPDEKVENRAAWLSQNVFAEKPIDEEAVAAMKGMGAARAMELMKEIEEKSEQIKNPSGYLKSAARREGFAPPTDTDRTKSVGNGVSGIGGGQGIAGGKVNRKVTWLNKNIFVGNPIDSKALDAIRDLGPSRAMDILKDMEEKGTGIKNPSSYLFAAVKREDVGGAIAVSVPAQGKGGGKGAAHEYEKVEKRAAWLNKFVFRSNPIDEEAVAAMKGMGRVRAMELFKEIEEKGDQLRNPSAYLKKAAIREGFAPPEASAKVTGKKAGSSNDKVQKRANWLNKNTFADNPIDDEAIAVMMQLDIPQAMEFFKELEGKADEVKNPSAYLVGLIKKGSGGQSHGVKRKAPQPANRTSKQDTTLKKVKIQEST